MVYSMICMIYGTFQRIGDPAEVTKSLQNDSIHFRQCRRQLKCDLKVKPGDFGVPDRKVG